MPTHIRSQYIEADGDQLLRVPLSHLRVAAAACESPNHDQPGDALDQAIHAEADQGDRGGGHTGSDCDAELDDVPADSGPRKQPRSPNEL